MDQFKTLEDIRDYIKSLGKFFARPTERGAHPTLYLDATQSGVVQGVRKRDYLFSPDEQWVLPCETMGLSFSAHWQHLKRIYRLKQKVTEGKQIDVFWGFRKRRHPLRSEICARSQRSPALPACGTRENAHQRAGAQVELDCGQDVENRKRGEGSMIEYKFPEEKVILLHYAEKMGADDARGILAKGYVENRSEAKALSSFYWKMVDMAVEDKGAGLPVLESEGVPPWMEYICHSLNGYLVSNGYAEEWDAE